MTKADLVERVTTQISRTAGPMISKKDCARVVDAFLEAIKESLQTQENIEVRGFGTFKIRNRKTRMARNPFPCSSHQRNCEPSSLAWTCPRCRKHKDLASQRSRGTARVHSDGAAVRFIRRKFRRRHSPTPSQNRQHSCGSPRPSASASRGFDSFGLSPPRRQP